MTACLLSHFAHLRPSSAGIAPLAGPWEMQLGTVETVAPDRGTISANFQANTSLPTLSSFVSVGATGYLTGVVSGIGTWTIRSGPDTIDGTNYAGAGLLVATGANTHNGPTVLQAGSKLQLGAACSNTTTWTKGNVTTNTGSVLTQYSAHTTNTTITQGFINGGTYNLIGCGACGQGGLLSSSNVTNTGTINIDKVAWRNTSTWSGTGGVVNVLDGGTFYLGTIPPNSSQFNLNGCGWCNSSGQLLGALHQSISGVTYGMPINVQTDSCISGVSGVNNTFSGLLTGSAPLTIKNLGITGSGLIHFSNTANTYSGTMTLDGTALKGDYLNSLQFAKMNIVNGGFITSSTGQNVGSLSGDSTARWLSADFQSHIIKNNGITTYAGQLLWNGGTNTANWYLDGPSTNVLTMTRTGNTGNIYPRNGSKLILQGGTFTGTNGQVRVSGGSTVSAGTSTTGGAVLIYLDAGTALDVYASGASTGIINTGPGTNLLASGWKVNLKNPLPAGTHVLWRNTGAAITELPVIGENLSGRTVTGFAWNNAVSPRTLSVTLA